MKNQKGFSLVELLVVVIIIAIVAAIAIPSLLASRRAANEASAISSLRTIHSAQVTYFATAGTNTTYGTLALLGPTGVGAQSLIDGQLASGTKSGYGFTLNTGTGAYCALATPTTAGLLGTGNRWFGVGTQGVIFEAAATGTITCAATGALAGGTAIQ